MFLYRYLSNPTIVKKKCEKKREKKCYSNMIMSPFSNLEMSPFVSELGSLKRLLTIEVKKHDKGVDNYEYQRGG